MPVFQKTPTLWANAKMDPPKTGPKYPPVLLTLSNKGVQKYPPNNKTPPVTSKPDFLLFLLLQVVSAYWPAGDSGNWLKVRVPLQTRFCQSGGCSLLLFRPLVTAQNRQSPILPASPRHLVNSDFRHQLASTPADSTNTSIYAAFGRNCQTQSLPFSSATHLCHAVILTFNLLSSTFSSSTLASGIHLETQQLAFATMVSSVLLVKDGVHFC